MIVSGRDAVHQVVDKVPVVSQNHVVQLFVIYA